MKKLAIYSLILLAVARCSGNSAGIKFDASVPSDQRSMIELDLNRMDEFSVPPPTTNELAAIGIGALTPAAMNAWLAQRVSVIVGESFDWESNVQKSSAGKSPVVMSQLRLDPMITAEAKTVMWNLGSYLFLNGKADGFTYLLNLSNGVMSIDSTRSGAVQIGEGLFTVNAVSGVPVTSFVNSILRIGTYFHEGRHSDGNGTNAGFPHSQCTSGDYKDLYACESNLNGPYAIQSILLKQLYYACTNCSQTELEGLLLSIADYKSRLMPGAAFRDARPEALAEVQR